MSPGHSYPVTAVLFVLGAGVTAVFSGSLTMLAKNAGMTEVLVVGMIVPSFTWIIQLSVSGLCLAPRLRRLYWGSLGRICLLGSLALLPAAAMNLLVTGVPLWLSTANVLLSVAIMAADLFRRSARQGLAPIWPVSWCLTIVLNMALFVWASRGWWGPA